MCVIVLVLAAMAVGLGGLFLLAKAQKENLGKLYSTAAYVVITICSLVIVFAIAAAILHCCHGGGCKDGGKGCGKNKTENSCHKGGDGGCPMMKGGCSSDESCGSSSSCSKGEGGSCSKGSMKCGKGGSCSKSGSGSHCKMMTKKIIIDDSVDVDVKVIAK